MTASPREARLSWKSIARYRGRLGVIERRRWSSLMYADIRNIFEPLPGNIAGSCSVAGR